ncbi:uncharacterized protein LOC34617399 [Cyclospora cayetanensis]|uniref:Uncharacterized protein LOC34617399 n=1 Tax=Cyclospora cayetanensis TaxID=88456 RepID=A0A6P6RUF5_9EIME|nr:uncharacterized protein LOC34617399 [Cyclospora cayetanensis]
MKRFRLLAYCPGYHGFSGARIPSVCLPIAAPQNTGLWTAGTALHCRRSSTLKTPPHWLEDCFKPPNSQAAGSPRGGTACNDERTIAPSAEIQGEHVTEEESKLQQKAIHPDHGNAARSLKHEGLGNETISSRHHAVVKHLLRLKSRRRYRTACGEMAVLGIDTLHGICDAHMQTSIFCSNSDVPPPPEGADGESTPWRAEPSLILTDSMSFASTASPSVFGAAEIRLATQSVMNAVLERNEAAYAAAGPKSEVKRQRKGATAAREAKQEETGRPSSTRRLIQAAAILKMPKPCKEFGRPRFILALDRIRYVFNLGILLRAAALMEVDVSGYKGLCCILGSESHGPSDFIREHALKVSFPMAAYVESLNVAIAGGLMLSSLRPVLSHLGNENPASIAVHSA